MAIAIGLACFLTAGEALAQQAEPDFRTMVSYILERLAGYHFVGDMLEAAKNLFWSLAAISLVWTMAVHLVRQDIGDMMMELIRFMVVTGFFYWMLINVTEWNEGGHGFVQLIIESFMEMPQGVPNDSLNVTNANSLLAKGFTVFFATVDDVAGGEVPDQLLGVSLATIVLILLACLAAQFLLLIVMAWVLAFAGVFLLGFGGSRWTSQVAINYYKHVFAVGAALVSLTAIGTIGDRLLGELGPSSQAGIRSVGQYGYLGLMIGVSVLMLVLGVRVPQLVYALVTQSPVGLFVGTAAAAGTAIASGGNAIAASLHRPPQGGGPADAAGAVMSAVSRGAPGGDAFHVGSGTDPFGVPRRADPLRHGTAFGRATTTATPVGTDEGGRAEGWRDMSRGSELDAAKGAGARPPDYSAELDQAVASRAQRYEGKQGATRPSMGGGDAVDVHHERELPHAAAAAGAATGNSDGTLGGRPMAHAPYAGHGPSTMGGPIDPHMESADLTSTLQPEHAARRASTVADVASVPTSIDPVATDIRHESVRDDAVSGATHVDAQPRVGAGVSSATPGVPLPAIAEGAPTAVEISHAMPTTGAEAHAPSPFLRKPGHASPIEPALTSHAPAMVTDTRATTHEMIGSGALTGNTAPQSIATATHPEAANISTVETGTSPPRSVAGSASTGHESHEEASHGPGVHGAVPVDSAHTRSHAGHAPEAEASIAATSTVTSAAHSHGAIPPGTTPTITTTDTPIQPADASVTAAAAAHGRPHTKGDPEKNDLATSMAEPVLGTASPSAATGEAVHDAPPVSDPATQADEDAVKPRRKRRHRRGAASATESLAPEAAAIQPVPVEAPPEDDGHTNEGGPA
ncbi:P-type conjugative transfer protein TrbL [Luteibacter yeojuensis]|uniref:P-type conjugative transfer protein TrbL n=1 Tax=Luteibacter yeojuensis TaxID=345309 RepID=A0A0F3L0D3_9GAMM|nr:P-type conjugative transfer protein TrbL [Luteibacter yeojuensis]KJV35819.1 hypothetical protein VI08_07520 [Luteibacter yeojuensis]